MPRYQSMIDWWEEHGPPVYLAVAGYLGLIKEPKTKADPKKPSQSKAASAGNLNDLLKMAGAGGIIQ